MDRSHRRLLTEGSQISVESPRSARQGAERHNPEPGAPQDHKILAKTRKVCGEQF